MRRLLVCLLLPACAARARGQVLEAAAREVPRIVVPGAPIGSAGGAILLTAPTQPLIAPPGLILPSAPAIAAPEPWIVTAARPLTEAEASAEKLPSREDLDKLAFSLAPSAEVSAPNARPADSAPGLDSAFDGRRWPEAKAWRAVAPEFARGPLSPGLPVLETAARSLIARLLPRLYRRIPLTARYDRGENPTTGNLWNPETGHVVEIAPVTANSRGEVSTAFGGTPAARVQQKIEFLMQFAHEYFHVLFDDAVRRKTDHSPRSAYAAMTEGFAVGGEQLLISRMLDAAPSLGFGPRDAMDLSSLARSRSQWLDVEDNHYSEGIISWRKAYDQGGATGLLAFLSALSGPRMAAVPRSDPAYQLALGEPALLSAYLGRDETSAERRGLEAFAKAARGEKLDESQAREASAVVDRAGADAWRRAFERTLFADKSLESPKTAAATSRWYKKDATEPSGSIEPAAALARLSPAAGAALARFLADAVSAPTGAARLFDRPGPSAKLNAVAAVAETLPWDEAGRRAWDAGLMSWLTGSQFASVDFGASRIQTESDGLIAGRDGVSLPSRAANALEAELAVFRRPNGRPISNGVAFRNAGVKTPEVLTLRIKSFFLKKILSGEKKFEYRMMSSQNDALIKAANQRGAKYLRLHFQDNDIQLLAEIKKIDVVPGAQAAEPWDAEQGTEPGDAPHWRIALRSPTLIWDNPKARAYAAARP
ncbi:MAG: hypothetical protein ACHQ49_04045 [Elusimicrobiota bacterium]